MKHPFGVISALALVCLPSVTACAKEPKTDAVAKPPKANHEPYFVHPDRLPLTTMIPAPPAEDSATTKAEFAELHRIQDARTPARGQLCAQPPGLRGSHGQRS